MTDKKVTIMELKVDLQCPCCYKKIKKILCKFPQIRDKKYDEKQSTVTITVVCGDPEKFRCQLRCVGGKIIKSIEIKRPPTPGPDKPPCCEDRCRPCGTCSGCVREGPCCEDHCGPTCGTCGTCSGCVSGEPRCEDHCRPTCGTCSGCVCGGPCRQDHCRPKCCGTCSGCVVGGPCCQGPKYPVPCFDNCGDGPCGFCGTRCGRVYFSGRCDYIWEENPSACSIM